MFGRATITLGIGPHSSYTYSLREKHVRLTQMMYLHYLVKMKHRNSYFYNALLEYYPLHQAWCET